MSYRVPKIEEFVEGFEYEMRAFNSKDWSNSLKNKYPRTPYNIGFKNPKEYILTALNKNLIRVNDEERT